MDDLITKIEAVIDAHPVLTRQRATSALLDEAEICFYRGGCRARVRVRSRVARGRGAKSMHEIWGDGETPDAAVGKLIDSLPHWTEALS